MTEATRFNVGVTGILLGLAAVAWYIAGSGSVGMGSMELSVPIYVVTWLAMSYSGKLAYCLPTECAIEIPWRV